jgi:acyl-CoA synthetase (AMP-forming)/AMP-acid ligase II
VRPGHQVTEAEIIASTARELGSYKKPAQVVFQTEPLTRSPVGKIKRKAMREPYWANHDTRVAGS